MTPKQVKQAIQAKKQASRLVRLQQRAAKLGLDVTGKTAEQLNQEIQAQHKAQHKI